MKIKLVEVTNGPNNWGKFLLGRFDTEWDYKSTIDGISIIAGRGWSLDHFLLLDLQTGEGAIFHPRGLAKADLDKHRIWVCPMYEPFLTWLYKQPDPFAIPAHVDLPDAEFAFAGYRRPGPGTELCESTFVNGCALPRGHKGICVRRHTLADNNAIAERLKTKLTEKQRQCLEYVAQGEKPPFKRTTVESLEKRGLVELQSGIGWRATQAGVDWLAAYEITHTHGVP